MSCFRTRAKLVRPNNKATGNMARTLSTPLSLGTAKEQRSPCPQPLPLPPPHCTALKTMGNSKAGNAGGPLFAAGPLPLPQVTTFGETDATKKLEMMEELEAELRFLNNQLSLINERKQYVLQHLNDLKGSAP
ncbi:hypothetical protein V6N13_013459 [Hibiscus sabdariffa]|uniref:Uncharacterized protein n=2 Tax=Hibiscus sabdariffa TaxID=183260 RepID=A0ABR2BVG8_9ROSI